MVPAPPLGRGMGKGQCCRKGTGATAWEPFTPLLARKTMCIPQMQSFSQFSPLASMIAPLAPSHGRGASWQVGELEFPSPACFHPSFRAGRTVQPSGTETQVRTSPGCCLGTQQRARSSPDLAPAEQQEPNHPPRSCARSTHPPAPSSAAQSPRSPNSVCFAAGKVVTNVQSRDAQWRPGLCKYNIIYWFHFRARVVFVRVS